MHINLINVLRFDKRDISITFIEHASLQHSLVTYPISFFDTSLYSSQFEGSELVEEQNNHFSGISILCPY